MKNAMEAMQEATKKELQAELAKKPGKEEVQAMIDETMRTVVGPSLGGSTMGWGTGTIGVGAEINRKMEMVFGGFARDTPRKEIIECIRGFIDQAGVAGVEVFTLRKYASTGIMKFIDMDGKRRWKMWLAAHGGLPDPYWTGDNHTKEERERRRKVGKVKAAICKRDPKGAGLHVDVDYDTCIVRYRRDIIAKFNGDELELLGAALEVKEDIEKMIKEMNEVGQ